MREGLDMSPARRGRPPFVMAEQESVALHCPVCRQPTRLLHRGPSRATEPPKPVLFAGRCPECHAVLELRVDR